MAVYRLKMHGQWLGVGLTPEESFHFGMTQELPADFNERAQQAYHQTTYRDNWTAPVEVGGVKIQLRPHMRSGFFGGFGQR